MIKLDVHHISFPISDLEKSKDFYQNVLGLEEIHRPDIYGIPGAWFSTGKCEVHLIQVEADMDVGTPPTKLNPAARHAAFAVEDYEKTLAYLKGKKIEVFETSAQIGQMWITDPDGHVLEFIRPAS